MLRATPIGDTWLASPIATDVMITLMANTVAPASVDPSNHGIDGGLCNSR